MDTIGKVVHIGHASCFLQHHRQAFDDLALNRQRSRAERLQEHTDGDRFLVEGHQLRRAIVLPPVELLVERPEGLVALNSVGAIQLKKNASLHEHLLYTRHISLNWPNSYLFVDFGFSCAGTSCNPMMICKGHPVTYMNIANAYRSSCRTLCQRKGRKV